MFEYGKSAYKNLQKVKIRVPHRAALVGTINLQSMSILTISIAVSTLKKTLEPVLLPAELSKFLIVNGAVDNPKKDQVQRAPGPYPFVVSCSN
jgi:hypothetical protein